MEKLWETIDTDLAQTVSFPFHGTLKQKKVRNNHNKHVTVQSLQRKH